MADAGSQPPVRDSVPSDTVSYGSTSTNSASNGSASIPAAAPGSAAKPSAALTGAAAANGRVGRSSGSRRDSDEIVADIERTRENLARTIDALADRVSPASNVRRLKERAAAELAKPEVQLAAAAIALAVTGYVIYRIVRGRRS
jgi:hypothetical protein